MNLGFSHLFLVIMLFTASIDPQAIMIESDITGTNPPSEVEPMSKVQLDSGLKHIISQDLTAHDPIVINYDQDFRDQGWPGTGTQEDPFRISNLSIIGLGDASVAIYRVSAHFIIENCELIGATVGILLDDVQNCIVLSCNISTTYAAIRLEYSENNRIVNNTIWDSHGGIEIVVSSNNIVLNNHIVT
ncbi:MAG: right-handed parallel beta-helix repeat-containing protein, partial [Candidatus Thorarchaeota archaeon]